MEEPLLVTVLLAVAEPDDGEAVVEDVDPLEEPQESFSRTVNWVESGLC